MTLKRLDATPALQRRLLAAVAYLPRRRQLPHLDRLVQAAADEFPRVRREGYTIDTILVAVGTLQTLEQVTHLDVPDAHALVERAGRNELGVGRNGDRRHAILDGERQVAVARLQIPDPDGPVATAGSNGAPVAGEIERVDVLVVTGERGADLSLLDVPDLDELVCARKPPTRTKLTLISLSSAPVARYLPSGLKQTLLM
jgi:hypothetical protein